METPPDGPFKCPTCSSEVFYEDRERSLAEFSERMKQIGPFLVGGTTKIEPPKFFLKCECGYQIQQEAQRPVTVTYTFALDPKKSD